MLLVLDVESVGAMLTFGVGVVCMAHVSKKSLGMRQGPVLIGRNTFDSPFPRPATVLCQVYLTPTHD
jgi:hypothetical protein